MKLGPDVLIAIMAAVQKGLLENVDISDELRKLELEMDKEDDSDQEVLHLKKS